MTYVILGWDGPDGQNKRPHHRPGHLEYLERLQQEGRLVCAGPLTDQTGSLVMIEAETLEEAERMANGDPYVTHGIFERVEIHPFKRVFPRQQGS